jgi:hypothetical protein
LANNNRSGRNNERIFSFTEPATKLEIFLSMSANSPLISANQKSAIVEQIQTTAIFFLTTTTKVDEDRH